MTLWKYSQQIPCTNKDLFKVLNKDPVISNKTDKWQLINKGLVAQSLSYGRLFVTPWTAARQDSLSFTIFWSLLKLMSIKTVMLSNHLILCCPFSFCLQSFPALESFPMSRLFASGGQNTVTLASVLPMNIQGGFSLGLTGLISLLSKGLLRVFSSIIAQKYQFTVTQPSLWSNSHIHTWLLEKP